MTFYPRLLAGLLAVFWASGCADDAVAPTIPRLDVFAEPVGSQEELADPVGINLKKVPLFGSGLAKFKLESAATANVLIESLSFTTETGGTFTVTLIKDGAVVTDFPVELGPFGADNDEAQLEVRFVPEADEVLGTAVVAIATNGGATGDDVIEVRVIGEGDFIGEPNLEIEYQGVTYALPEDCTVTSGPNGASVCQLPPLVFGNVSLDSTATDGLILRNAPTAGTCILPDLSAGEPNCEPACAVTFDRDAAAFDVGLGFEPADAGFSLVGGGGVPFQVSPAKPECPNGPTLVRGELPLLVNFAAGTEIVDATSEMILESNDPGAPIIVVPLEASAREAPVAEAKIRACDEANLPPDCSDPEALRPLERVFFDGRDSYDPNDAAINGYTWTIIKFPDPSLESSTLVQPQGNGTALFSFVPPIAGEYVVRLQVANENGVLSGVSATSDVTFEALPDARVHLQVIWDNPINDQDLHLVKVREDGTDFVYHGTDDCFWAQCRPTCLEDDDPCSPPLWGAGEPFSGPNPSLDLDDTGGLGPENINIEEPVAGKYRIYVHYYGLVDDEDAPTQVTARIYIDGALRNEFRQTLSRNDLWAVAEIEWKADESAVITSPGTDVTAVVPLSFIPSPSEGYAFSPSPF